MNNFDLTTAELESIIKSTSNVELVLHMRNQMLNSFAEMLKECLTIDTRIESDVATQTNQLYLYLTWRTKDTEIPLATVKRTVPKV